MSDNERIVGGFLFRNAVEYERAKKEKATIEKLKKNINPEDLEEMEVLYRRLTGKNYFATPVGLEFLHGMRDYLVEYGSEDLPLVPVPNWKNVTVRGADKETLQKMQNQLEKENQTKKRLVVTIVALALVVVGMFFIVVTNDHQGYFNAEDKILDKYASWQEELEEWEAELTLREEALNATNPGTTQKGTDSNSAK